MEVVITRRTRNAFAPFGHAGSNPAVSAKKGVLLITERYRAGLLFYSSDLLFFVIHTPKSNQQLTLT